MKIIVSNIPEEGLNLRFLKSRGWLESATSDNADPLTCVQDIQVSCQLRRLGENVFLEGSIETALELACCRCLEGALLAVDASFRYTLSPCPEEQGSEVELGSEDLEFSYYSEDTIDLEPLLLEQVLLQIPMRVLCREDCRGLCPRCGANLNAEACRCREPVVDERLAVLKNLKIQKK